MRFVRVPPYESWANLTNFFSSWENGDFFWGQKCCILFPTQNEEKSKKISTCICIHTHVYAQVLETQMLETEVLEHPLSAVVAYQGPVKRENIKKYGTRQGGNLTEKLMK